MDHRNASKIGRPFLRDKVGSGRAIVITLFAAMLGLVVAAPLWGGTYRNSAHGDGMHGVNRSAIEPRFAEYATGNCAHCHQMHASFDGAAPQPLSGGAPYVLFYRNFNSARTQNLYMETDNFCFFCHSGDSGQQVINQDYSATFGGAASGSGPQSILEAFNQESYHNLFDIWNYARTNTAYPWFDEHSNPCSACHNPHLARRNGDSSKPGFPLLSAISKPSDRSRLWGETELMASYLSYEAPYVFDLSREPAGVGDADGAKTPDYVGFCTECHNPANTIWSTTLNRNLRRINWGTTGENQDKHGARPREGHPYSYETPRWAEPYLAASSTKNNFVMSCLDCHEPHGSQNIMLLRRRVNGGNLGETITATAPNNLLPLCVRCHNRDYITQLHGEPGYLGPGDDWEVVSCRDCHHHGGRF